MHVIEFVKDEVLREHDRAAKKFGMTNNSHHESYAVILEEYEESQEATVLFLMQMKNYWKAVRNNNPEEATVLLDAMQAHAEQAAAEFIQVAAMCHKAKVQKK
ncbi:MAG: hypothetical protein FWC70_05555 [Defluviitaleaceae bacterium]|nr:hypothetical protein [Defluviitaleaceae bacterium]